MANLKYAVGVDMAKADFKACVSVIDDQQKVTVKSNANFNNTLAGFKDFSKWIAKHVRETIPSHILMEATGIYYEQLAWYLYNKDYRVSVILPNKAKKYLQSLGLKSKNDKIDAKGLAQMCAQQSLPLWAPLSKVIYELRALTRLHEDLAVQVGSLKNQLHALDCSMFNLGEAKNILTKLIKTMQKEIKKILANIQEIIMGDALLKDKYEKITCIKGLGLLSFAVVIAETNGFELFDSRSQLTSYAGYDVIENQSGGKTGKTRMSKKGNTHIRRILHMPAFNVVKYEPSFKEFFNRVFDNTNMKMKAYVAVQRRLLNLMYTLWKNDVAFEPDYLAKQVSNLIENEKSQAHCALAH